MNFPLTLNIASMVHPEPRRPDALPAAIKRVSGAWVCHARQRGGGSLLHGGFFTPPRAVQNDSEKHIVTLRRAV